MKAQARSSTGKFMDLETNFGVVGVVVGATGDDPPSPFSAHFRGSLTRIGLDAVIGQLDLSVRSPLSRSPLPQNACHGSAVSPTF